MEAARWGFKQVVELLIAAGADVDARNERGRTALMEAARWGYTKNIIELLESKSNEE